MRGSTAALAVLAWGWAATAAATPPAEEGRPVTIARSFGLRSEVLKQERRVTVYLPAGYARGEGTYPVLYLLDGGEHEDFVHVAGLASLGELNGTTREMIVVGVENVDRKHDLTPPSNDPRDRRDLPTHGGSAEFRSFLARELKPWVEGRYRTSGEDALMGESLAGLFVVETFLKQPQLFDRYVAVSPSLWWDAGALAREAPARLAAGGFEGRALYLSIADEGGGMQEGVDALVTALRTAAPKGLDWRYEPLPDERHHSIYHPAALKALRALFPGPTATGAP